MREAIRVAVHVEPLTESIARLAGEGDVEDMEALRASFPGVHVLVPRKPHAT